MYHDTVLQHGLGLAYRENFTYGRTISDSVLKITQEAGYIDQVERRWTLGSCPDNIQPAQFGWMYFSGILLLVAGGVVLGLISNLVEYYFYSDKLKSNSLSSQTKELFQANRALQRQFNEYDKRKVDFGQNGTYTTSTAI